MNNRTVHRAHMEQGTRDLHAILFRKKRRFFALVVSPRDFTLKVEGLWMLIGPNASPKPCARSSAN